MTNVKNSHIMCVKCHRTTKHTGGYNDTIHHQDEVHLEQHIKNIPIQEGMMDRIDCHIRTEISNALEASLGCLQVQG